MARHGCAKYAVGIVVQDPMPTRGTGVVERCSALFITLAAALWAADAYFRPALVKDGLTSSQIVLLEDVLITLCLLPVARTVVREVRSASWKTWLALFIIAAGPQAFATVLFTRSLSYATSRGAQSEVYLLYLLEPVFGLTLSWLILKERRARSFWPLAVVALGGAYLIVTAEVPGAPSGELLAAIFVLAAIALWAAGTVFGRMALSDVSFATTATMRFALALPILLVLMVTTNNGLAELSGYSLSELPAFLGIALIPGTLAMLLYYRALSHTPASISTLAELGYPAALFLIFSLPAPYGFSAPLRPAELFGAILLVFAVTAMNLQKYRGSVTTRTAAQLQLQCEPAPD